MRKVFQIFVALLWFATANHCFVTLALATSAQKMPACHAEHSKQGSSDKARSDKVPCDQRACCQPIVMSAADTLSTPLLALTQIFSLPAFFALLSPELSIEQPRATTHAHAPPGSSAILTLTLAPNAPPLSR